MLERCRGMTKYDRYTLSEMIQSTMRVRVDGLLVAVEWSSICVFLFWGWFWVWHLITEINFWWSFDRTYAVHDHSFQIPCFPFRRHRPAWSSPKNNLPRLNSRRCFIPPHSQYHNCRPSIFRLSFDSPHNFLIRYNRFRSAGTNFYEIAFVFVATFVVLTVLEGEENSRVSKDEWIKSMDAIDIEWVEGWVMKYAGTHCRRRSWGKHRTNRTLTEHAKQRGWQWQQKLTKRRMWNLRRWLWQRSRDLATSSSSPSSSSSLRGRSRSFRWIWSSVTDVCSFGLVGKELLSFAPWLERSAPE